MKSDDKNKKMTAEPFKLPPRPAASMPSKPMSYPTISAPKPEMPKPAMQSMPKPAMKSESHLQGLQTIQNVRHPEPHLFIKVDKYTDVRASVKKMNERLKDLTATLAKMENLKDEEVKKIDTLKGAMKRMEDVVIDLEKTFKEAREDYE